MGEVAYVEKLEGLPLVVYITLNNENLDRKQFMESQFNHYGIKHKAFLTERLFNMQDVNITGTPIDNNESGICISHLNCMKAWYDSCDDDTVIFCEDDISFESIDYWNFTWNEFVNSLPESWECVQLIRIVSPAEDYNLVEPLQSLDLKWGRWWGASSLMKRSYVKKVLDRHILDSNVYLMGLPEIGIMPIVENILFVGLGATYNYPLLVEGESLDSTMKHINYASEEDYIKDKQHHIMSRKMIMDCWKQNFRE
ncbi:hypothetical protein UFOVP49_110 [uncultured Caudovirales phage]|uniref:Uncharacterized protein n=1 Tax=uncultured Caudovirales phage TaxID=2100421 RepID=A0A6J5KSN6_9CAUD|nr:hypothetical protein UFOVP49_110 [uncultured Caudovirales phage]